MRIAFVNQMLCGGGAERVTVNLAGGLVSQPDMEVFLITGTRTEADYPCDERVRRICLLRNSLLQDVLALRKALIDNRIDAAVGMGIYANFCVCMANWGISTKMIISERNAPAQDHISWKSKLLRFLVYRNADAYVFQTPGARDFYSSSIQRRGVVIPNPIKDGLPIRMGAKKKEIVAVGRLMPQKNYPVLLKAFAIICKEEPDYVLRIFGQGLEETRLKEICAALGICDRVHFEGFCRNVHEKIIDSDIYVLSSDFEGLPNALMEAMAMGFPVVSTDCPTGGPRMLIEHGENGLLCPVGNAENMAESILYLIRDPHAKEYIASNARKTSSAYSMEKITLQWSALFNNIKMNDRENLDLR